MAVDIAFETTLESVPDALVRLDMRERQRGLLMLSKLPWDYRPAHAIVASWAEERVRALAVAACYDTQVPGLSWLSSAIRALRHPDQTWPEVAPGQPLMSLPRFDRWPAVTRAAWGKHWTDSPDHYVVNPDFAAPPEEEAPDCIMCSFPQGHTLVRLLGYNQGLTGSCNITALSALLYARAEEPFHNTTDGSS